MKHEKARYKFIYYLKSYLIFIKFFINKQGFKSIDKFHKDYAKEIHLDVFNDTNFRLSVFFKKCFHFNYLKYLKIVDSLNNQSWRTLYYYFHNRHYITQEEVIDFNSNR